MHSPGTTPVRLVSGLFGAPTGTSTVPVTLRSGSFLSMVTAQAGGALGLGATRQCLSSSATPGCLNGQPGPGGGTTVSSGTDQHSGTASGNQWQPGQLPAGSYQAQFQSVSTPDGTKTAFLTLLIN